MKKYNTVAELKWVFLSNGTITPTEAIRLLCDRVKTNVDRDDFSIAFKALLESEYIIACGDNMWRKNI